MSEEPQPGPPESPSMTKLAEIVIALSERMAALEARLAPKPRASKPGGHYMGRPGRHRFGFHPHARIPGRLVEDFDEQQTINLIVQARADGMGPRTICGLLDSLRRTRRGKKWTPNGYSLVRSILERAR